MTIESDVTVPVPVDEEEEVSVQTAAAAAAEEEEIEGASTETENEDKILAEEAETNADQTIEGGGEPSAPVIEKEAAEAAAAAVADTTADEDDVVKTTSGGTDVADEDATAPSAESGESTTHLSDIKFSQLNHRLSYMSIRAVATLPYEYMTQVQKSTMPSIMAGHDCLVKAPTGTGKTMAFLLPMLDDIYTREFGKRPLSQRQYKRMIEQREAAKAAGEPAPKERRIRILVLAPTRELAMQIGQEAEKLLGVQKRIRIGLFYGGRKIMWDMKRLLGRVDIAVCTPGRMIDLMDQDPEFKERLQGVEAVVLDEADRMLDAGFADAMKTITAALPKERQTLLFSATLPSEIVTLAPKILAHKPTFEYFDTTKRDPHDQNLVLRETYCSESASATDRIENPGKLVADDPLAVAKHIKQYYVQAELKDQAALLYRAIMHEVRENPEDYKIIVFFTTTRAVELNTQLFQQMSNMAGEETAGLANIMEMHSKKDQRERERVSRAFKQSRRGIMFTSDVTARGMDYPGVTLVAQMGIAASTEQYVHRLGRTGRAGKAGKGVIIVLPDEVSFVEELKESNVQVLEAKAGDDFGRPESDEELETLNQMINMRMDNIPPYMKNANYVSWLGFYNNALRVTAWSRGRLLAIAEELALDVMRMREVPYLSPAVTQAMGLAGVLDKAYREGSARAAFPPGHTDRFSQRALRDRQAKNFTGRRFEQFRKLDVAKGTFEDGTPRSRLSRDDYRRPRESDYDDEYYYGGGGGGGGGGAVGGKRRQQRTCFVCRDTGHIARDCPENEGRLGANGGCFRCGSEEHSQRNCPKSECRRCGEMGHMVPDCPKPDLTRGQRCFGCGEEGHLRHQCPLNNNGGIDDARRRSGISAAGRGLLFGGGGYHRSQGSRGGYDDGHDGGGYSSGDRSDGGYGAQGGRGGGGIIGSVGGDDAGPGESEYNYGGSGGGDGSDSYDDESSSYESGSHDGGSHSFFEQTTQTASSTISSSSLGRRRLSKTSSAFPSSRPNFGLGSGSRSINSSIRSSGLANTTVATGLLGLAAVLMVPMASMVFLAKKKRAMKLVSQTTGDSATGTTKVAKKTAVASDRIRHNRHYVDDAVDPLLIV